MSKRLLALNPTELISLNRQEIIDGIRASEGRTVGAYVCPKAPNYVEKVSNVELVSSFGADFVTLEGYDLHDIQIPGLPSKNPSDDAKTIDELQVEMGKGWTIPELKRLVGRPIATILLVMPEAQVMKGIYEKPVWSMDMMQFVVDEGYDIVCLCSFEQDILLDAVRQSKEKFGDKIVIEAGIPHGTGSIVDDNDPPFNLREIVNPEFVGELAKAGADIVDLPTVGVVPGFTMEYVTSLVDAVHANHSIAAACVAHSIEASSKEVLERIVMDNKICGVDMYNIAAGGVYESVTLPEALMDICIAVKGKRHTYRRMAQSPLR